MHELMEYFSNKKIFYNYSLNFCSNIFVHYMLKVQLNKVFLLNFNIYYQYCPYYYFKHLLNYLLLILFYLFFDNKYLSEFYINFINFNLFIYQINFLN